MKVRIWCFNVIVHVSLFVACARYVFRTKEFFCKVEYPNSTALKIEVTKALKLKYVLPNFPKRKVLHKVVMVWPGYRHLTFVLVLKLYLFYLTWMHTLFYNHLAKHLQFLFFGVRLELLNTNMNKLYKRKQSASLFMKDVRAEELNLTRRAVLVCEPLLYFMNYYFYEWSLNLSHPSLVKVEINIPSGTCSWTLTLVLSFLNLLLTKRFIRLGLNHLNWVAPAWRKSRLERIVSH